jgi:hypothetical protein
LERARFRGGSLEHSGGENENAPPTSGVLVSQAISIIRELHKTTGQRDRVHMDAGYFRPHGRCCDRSARTLSSTPICPTSPITEVIGIGRRNPLNRVPQDDDY